MREYRLDARKVKNPIYPSPIGMGGKDDRGVELAVGNYYITKGGEPFFAICGEAHFSRINAELWEDEIVKMKMGGINIIASYVFWIHHEEIKGEYDWSGNKNLRRFIELCKKHRMYVILRIGPFVHGECRNGGFPDWLFGVPFDIREDNEEYLSLTRNFYQAIYDQAKGLLYKEGGPVIGVQIENEHEHASCPWEMTTENSKEWVVPGRYGVRHMGTLKRIAMEVGFEVPLYTATAWGGACAPIDTVFPLWGGYAFRPWMFYDENLKKHPATEEYLYGDFHNNEAPMYYNFDPKYPAEDYPYACCEMGGGMNVYYPYRFRLPYKSVGALAQVKVGSGCNFLGYYMYHGGTHPKGKRTPYLNEGAVPKFSYDYQAPIGEFGQVRESYHQLKLQHMFYKEFQKEFTATKTVLSKEAKVQVPEDVKTLRYAVRMDENGRGFLFINNYQDHVEGIPQNDFKISVDTDLGEITIPHSGSLNIAKESYAILPLFFELNDLTLIYSTTQLVTRISSPEEDVYFFTQVPGMDGEYYIEQSSQRFEFYNCKAEGSLIHILDKSKNSFFSFVNKDGKKIIVCTLSIENAGKFWVGEHKGRKIVILSEAPVLIKDERIWLEYRLEEQVQLAVYPATNEELEISGLKLKNLGKEGIFTRFSSYRMNFPFSLETIDCSSKNTDADGVLKRPVVGSPIASTKIVNVRKKLHFKEEDFLGMKQVLLRIDYEGDIGYAFINGEMIHDNFCNGATWEFDLVPYKDEILKYGIDIYISPKKEGAYVDNSSAMAARFEIIKEQIASINSIKLQGVKNIEICWE